MMGIAGASDLVDGGKKAGQAWVDAYTGKCYHQACDAWGPDWNLDGAVQDLDIFYRIGDELARSARWPGWKAGSEVNAIRQGEERNGGGVGRVCEGGWDEGGAGATK